MIIGLGSGRCGTCSLAAVLGLPHEALAMPWIPDEGSFQYTLAKVEKHGGDVGMYWLNYVEWMLGRHPETRFCCLQRGRAATIRSWVERMRPRKKFQMQAILVNPERPWVQHNLFPEYGEIPLEEAVSRFYDEYYGKAYHWQYVYPESFRIFSMDEVLNTEKGQEELLLFCGLAGREPVVHVHKNKQKRTNYFSAGHTQLVKETLENMPAEARAQMQAGARMVHTMKKALIA